MLLIIISAILLSLAISYTVVIIENFPTIVSNCFSFLKNNINSRSVLFIYSLLISILLTTLFDILVTVITGSPILIRGQPIGSFIFPFITVLINYCILIIKSTKKDILDSEKQEDKTID